MFAQRPLVWAACGFLAGTCAGLLLPPIHGAFGVNLLTMAAYASPVLFLLAAGLALRNRAAVAVAAMAAVGLANAALHQGPRGDQLSEWLLAHGPAQVLLEGAVRSGSIPGGDEASPPGAAPRRAHIVLDVSRHYLDGEWHERQGRVWVSCGDVSRLPYPGDVVRVRGEARAEIGMVNFGVAGFEGYCRNRGIHGVVLAKGRAPLEVVSPAPPWHPLRFFAYLREQQAQLFSTAVPDAAAPLVRAMWLGDRDGIPGDVYDAYVRAGGAHLLSVSGLHLGIFFVTLQGFFSVLVRDKRKLALLLVVSLVAVVLMTGGRLPVTRAALMLGLFVMAGLFRREPDAPTSLAIALIGLLFFNPRLVFDVGFQLSFLSVASLLLWHEPLRRALTAAPAAAGRRMDRTMTIRSSAVWRRLEEHPAAAYAQQGWAAASSLLAASAAVQLLPLPAAVYHFHVLPLFALPVNLLAVPLLAVVLWMTALTVFAGVILPGIAPLFGHGTGICVWLLDALVGGVGERPWAAVDMPAPSIPALACTYAGFGLAYHAVREPRWTSAALARIRASVLAHNRSHAPAHRRTWLYAGGMLLLSGALLWTQHPSSAEIVFIDVRNGDATFIRTPGGETLLIDAGGAGPYGAGGGEAVCAFLRQNGIQRIDIAIASHADLDHIGGFALVLERFPVGRMVLPPNQSDKALERDVLALCAKRGIPIERWAKGKSMTFPGALLEVLHPPEDWNSALPSNEQSLVLRYRWGELDVLLPGDIEHVSEAALAQAAVQADVLKLPHHGRNTSSTEPFLDAVEAQAVTISSGVSLSHPGIHPSVRARIDARALPAWVTAFHGAIRIRETGGTFRFESARQRAGYAMSRVPTLVAITFE